MAAIVVHHALGDAGRPRCVENVERMARCDRNAGRGLGRIPYIVPGGVAAVQEGRGEFGALQYNHPRHLVRSKVERGVEQRLRSEEHTSELQSLMRSSYAVFCLKKKKS